MSRWSTCSPTTPTRTTSRATTSPGRPKGLLRHAFRDVGVRAARTGFGVYRGVAGSLKELDERLSGRKVGLDLRLPRGRVRHQRAVLFWPGRRRPARRRHRRRGASAARIGSDKQTNLCSAASPRRHRPAQHHPARAHTERVPILLRSEVTNQPAGKSADVDGDRAIRLARGDVGPARRVGAARSASSAIASSRVTLAARGSYQGRTINHAGPGSGGR